MKSDMLDPIGHMGHLIGFGMSALRVLEKDKTGQITASECYLAAVDAYPPKDDDERAEFRRFADFILLIEDVLEELDTSISDRLLLTLGVGAMKSSNKESKRNTRKKIQELLENIIVQPEHSSS
ncbi:hypothetical protein GN316_22325 [Xylophilus sp. Kf1]|nr:hypothetical protein [Xylophilus sp. Kf1]